MPTFKFALALGVFAASAASADAGEFRVKEVRAYLFFSQTGALSENIVGSKKEFFNTIVGERQAGGAASHVLIDLALVSEPGAPKTATAPMKVSWRAKGKETSLSRAYDNSNFEEGEVRHEAVPIENATCAPVKIEVSTTLAFYIRRRLRGAYHSAGNACVAAA